MTSLAASTLPTQWAGVGNRGMLTEMRPCVMPETMTGTMSGMI
jgi:hypothetical protein